MERKFRAKSVWTVLALTIIVGVGIKVWDLGREERRLLPPETYTRPPKVMPKPGPISAVDTEIEALIARFHADPSKKLKASIQAYGARAVHVILRLLQVMTSDARRRASDCELILAIGQTATPIVIEALEHSRLTGFSSCMIEYLGALKNRRAVPVLLRVFEGKDLQLRKASAKALGELGDASVGMTLAEGLDRAALRSTVLHALAQLGSVDALPMVIKLWKGGGLDGVLQELIYLYVIAIGPDALPLLLRELGSHQEKEARSWKRRLGHTFLNERVLAKSAAWRKRLVSSFPAGDRETKRAVLYVLQQPLRFPDLSARVRSWWPSIEKKWQAQMVRAISRTAPVGDASAERFLRELVLDPTLPREVRRQAVDGLGQIGKSQKSRNALKATANGRDESLREAAQQALKQLKSRSLPG